MKAILPVLVGVSLALAGASADGQTQQPAHKQIKLSIERQTLRDALNEWAQQTGFQLVSEVSGDFVAPSVKGTLTPQAALERLLVGTPLTYEWLSDRVVAIRDRSQAVSPAAWQSSSNEVEQTLRIARFTADGDLSVGTGGGDTATGATERGLAAKDQADADIDELEEILVTGTHIRGAKMVGAPLVVISRDDIERSGFTTTQQVVQSLPQNFGSGANEATTAAGGPSSGGGSNLSYGSSVNLRGLGTDSTLVLLNGRRLSPSGLKNDFVDVSMIPVTAVERVEVLTDGASALYGSDAVGGVVNIVLRDNYQGAESRLGFGSVTDGQYNEIDLSQVLGTKWATGNVLFAYEYHDHDNLAAEDRAFASNSDLSRYGGDNFSSEASNPGNITDFISNFAIPHGQDGASLQPGQLLPGVVNRQNTLEETDLLPQQRRHSAFLSMSQSLTERANAFAELRYSNRKFENRGIAASDLLPVPPTNPFYVDPFGTGNPVFVQYSFINDLGPQVSTGEVQSYGATAGTSLSFSSTWQLQAYGSYSQQKEMLNGRNARNAPALQAALDRTDPATAFNPFGDGSHTNPATIDEIRGFVDQDARSRVWIAHTKADGHVFTSTGGNAKLALGAEYRKESFDFSELDFTSGDVPSISATNSGDRSVVAGFAELYVPLVVEGNGRVGLRRLDVSLAGRFEDYSDFGTTTDPRFGMSWSPISSLSFHGTIGTSFKAPLLSQLRPETIVAGFEFPDASSPTGSTNTLLVLGTNSGLEPETAKTWTVGVDWRPNESAFAVGFSYFRTKIEERIREPAANVFAVLGNDADYAAILTRNPSAAQVAALFNDPGFAFSTFPPEQTGAIIDDRVTNIAVVDLSGLDFSLKTIFWGGGAGSFDFRLNGTYLIDIEQAFSPTARAVDVVNTLGNPADLRLRLSGSWNVGGWSASAFVKYVGSYDDNVSVLNRRVPAWTTVDLQLAYTTDTIRAESFLRGVTAALNVRNLFDRSPPFVNNSYGVGFDAVNADPLNRFVSLQLTKRW